MLQRSDPSALQRKLALPKYLRQLSELIGRNVQAEELGSPEEARRVREFTATLAAKSEVAFEIPFIEKQSRAFLDYIRRLAVANPSSLQVWTPETIVCGFLEIPSLESMRWDFGFSTVPTGILSLVSTDLRDRLVLDFLAEGCEQRLRVELYGTHWSSVLYRENG